MSHHYSHSSHRSSKVASGNGHYSSGNSGYEYSSHGGDANYGSSSGYNGSSAGYSVSYSGGNGGYSGSSGYSGNGGSSSHGGHVSFSSNNQGSSYGGSSGSYHGGHSSEYTSHVLNSLLNAQAPIQINETEEITVNGQRGIFLNKQEVQSWRGSQPISSYEINQDSNPQVIRKNQQQNLDYVQNVNVRYLKPPSGQAGPIIIRQEPHRVAEPAPPIIIRQQPGGQQAQAPQVFREAPPKSFNLAPKEIVIKGKTLPPPPRKVVIERLAEAPQKPGDITIERWVAADNVKRRVIFKPAPNQPAQEKPRNVVIEWGPVKSNVRQQVNVRGVSEANPDDYIRQHGGQLIESSRLPRIALDVQAPSGHRLASSVGNQGVIELEGDIQALALVDLEREGLGEYREYLRRLGINSNSFNNNSSGGYSESTNYNSYDQTSGSSSSYGGHSYNNGSSHNYNSSSSGTNGYDSGSSTNYTSQTSYGSSSNQCVC